MRTAAKLGLMGWVFCVWAAPSASGKEEDLKLFQGVHWQSSLGSEFPGAGGSFQLAKEGDLNAGKLHFDFKDGGLYVAGNTRVQIPSGFRELRLQVKASTSQTVLLRLVDSGKQMHQYKLPCSGSGDWQTLRVSLKEKSPISYGGPKDRVLHFPIKQLWLGVENGNSEKEGDLFFSGLKLLD